MRETIRDREPPTHGANQPLTPAMTKASLLLCTALTTLAAHAHEGHGQPGATHWHSTDVFGFIALALGVAAAVWWIGRK